MSFEKSVVLGRLNRSVSLSLTFGLGSDVHVPPTKRTEIQARQIHTGLCFNFRVFVGQYQSCRHALKKHILGDVWVLSLWGAQAGIQRPYKWAVSFI